MSDSPVKLYTPEVLALATRLAAWPHDAAMAHHGRARSSSCGSVLVLSLDLDGEGRIARRGVSAQACAIGQAAAAIFAGEATGRSRAQIATTLADLESWLRGEGDQPDWPGLSAIAAAKAYPARHGALLLPWKAALDALP